MEEVEADLEAIEVTTAPATRVEEKEVENARRPVWQSYLVYLDFADLAASFIAVSKFAKMWRSVKNTRQKNRERRR